MSLAAAYYLSSRRNQPLPPIPTRDQILCVNCAMQGLTVQTRQYGAVPYWDGVLGWFDQSDRDAIYQALSNAGKTHCGVQLSGQYNEPGQFYTHIPGKDWTSDLPGFRALVLEVIRAGYFPLIFLAGDGLRFDAEGLTYGHDWLMEHLCEILISLDGLLPYCVLCPGYDGIIGYDESTQTFGPWSLDQVNAYLVWLRQQAPDCYSAIEPSAGPLNGTLPKFLSDGGYNALDLILNELNGPPNDDVTWQGAARLLGPSYVRPPDQPIGDDPDAPFGPNSPKWSCRVPTSRGEMKAAGFEYFTWAWVRDRVTSADVERWRQYLRRMGYPGAG